MGDRQAVDKTGFSSALLGWYDRHARGLPWRVPPGEPRRADPYHVLVSEVMLQQTTVAVVKTRYEAFLAQFPDIAALARAPQSAVMEAWAGLGYYRRARALHACAVAIEEQHGGVFPQTEKELKALPGIGDYTGAAIAAIAFGERAVVVDGNIERIVARLFEVLEPLPKARKVIRELTGRLTSHERPGDFAQAMMDLGAGICRPKAPDCLLCPVRAFCEAAASGTQERYPAKMPKKAKVVAEGVILVATDRDGRVRCERRGAEGLLAGTLGLPGGGWDGSPVPDLPEGAELAGEIEHVLTHRRLKIKVYRARAVGAGAAPLPPAEARSAMPSLFRKALDAAL